MQLNSRYDLYGLVLTQVANCFRSATGFEVLSLIAVSPQRSVCLARCKYSDQKVCLKVYNKGQLSQESRGLRISFSQVHREIRNHGKVTGRPGVVPLLCAFEDSKAIVLVSEWQDSFSSLTELFKGTEVPRDTVKKIAAGLLAAVEGVHSMNVMHGDIKPDNILYDPRTGQVKLLDFGLSKDLSVDKPSRPTGSPCFCAPEVIRPLLLSEDGLQTSTPGMIECESTLKSDIWSCGVVLYQLFTGKLPFYDSDKSACFRLIVSSDLPNLKKLSKDEADFLRRALEKDPEQRATASELGSDEWLVNGRLWRIQNRIRRSFDLGKSLLPFPVLCSNF